MGLGKWLLKNGPGSPGSTAKAIADIYIKLNSGNNTNPSEVFSNIYYTRQHTSSRFTNGGMFSYFDPEALYNYCEGDLSLFIVIIMYIETSQFRKGIHMGTGGLFDSLDVVRDVIKQRVPNVNILTIIIAREKSLHFINEIYPYEVP